MELNKELRDRINEYFDNISPEDLLQKALNIYGFELENSIEESFFKILNKDLFKSNKMEDVFDANESQYTLAA